MKLSISSHPWHDLDIEPGAPSVFKYVRTMVALLITRRCSKLIEE